MSSRSSSLTRDAVGARGGAAGEQVGEIGHGATSYGAPTARVTGRRHPNLGRAVVSGLQCADGHGAERPRRRPDRRRARGPPRRARSRRRSTRSTRAHARLPRRRPRAARGRAGTSGTHHDLLCDGAAPRPARPEARELEFVARHAALPRPRAGSRSPTSSRRSAATTTIVWDAVLDAVAATPARRGPGARRRADGDRLRRPRRDTGERRVPRCAAAAARRQRPRPPRPARGPARRRRAPQTAAGPGRGARRGPRGRRACVLVAARADRARRRTTGALPRAAQRARPAPCAARYAPLAVTRHGEIVLVRAGAAGERAGAASRRCERACARRRRRLVLAVGVSTVQRRPAALGAAYREASLALRRVAATPAACSRSPDLSAFEYLTLRNDAVARRLIAPGDRALRRRGPRARRHADRHAARLRRGRPQRQGGGRGAADPRQHRALPAGPDRGEDRAATCAGCRTSSTC